jgi:hypothetical protein
MYEIRVPEILMTFSGISGNLGDAMIVVGGGVRLICPHKVQTEDLSGHSSVGGTRMGDCDEWRLALWSLDAVT